MELKKNHASESGKIPQEEVEDSHHPQHGCSLLSQRLHSLMTAVFSGRLRELMMTKPKPSFSLRLMTTSLVCRAAPSEVAATMVAVGTETTGGPEAAAAAAPSLRGELCCVDTEPGLRPLTGHGSPGGRGQAGVSQ